MSQSNLIHQINNALPTAVCEQIIQRFESDSADHDMGRVGTDAVKNSALKKSTDLYISNKPQWQDIDALFFNSLALHLKRLGKSLPYFDDLSRFSDMGYNLQRYQPGEYYHWHVDADSPALAHRQLVALWYLNDVEQGGETEFKHQQLMVTPEVGKLILFPPYWTHEHRACVVEKGVKYIATTWLSFKQ